MKKILTQEQLLDKIKQFKDSGQFDLSSEEDLSLAIMNLVSLEEHFFFTAQKTGKDSYFDLLTQTREMRKSLLGRMISQHEGETWCIAKHLLAATMRLYEVGAKFQSQGKKDEAQDMFAKAFELYSLFWALRLQLINTKNLKKIDDNRLNVHDQLGAKHPWTKQDIINKLVDCCEE